MEKKSNAIVETIKGIGKVPALVIGGVLAIGGLAASAVMLKKRQEQKGVKGFLKKTFKRK